MSRFVGTPTVAYLLTKVSLSSTISTLPSILWGPTGVKRCHMFKQHVLWVPPRLTHGANGVICMSRFVCTPPFDPWCTPHPIIEVCMSRFVGTPTVAYLWTKVSLSSTISTLPSILWGPTGVKRCHMFKQPQSYLFWL